ncbi:MAG: hypothetical protein M3Z04_21150 [Chloroflexota bacterium]|nr:hypothetical protein [Chloroflexota bacterium]
MRMIRYFDRSALLLTLLLGVVGLAYIWVPTDPDVWWHIRSGQLVVQSGVPLTDPMSFTLPGARWVLHEWLTEVGMYLIEHYLGYLALVVLAALITVLTYALLYRVLRGLGSGPALAVGLVLVRTLMDAPTWGVRPQILVTLFFTVFLALVLRYRQVCRQPGLQPANELRGLAVWIGPDRWLWLLPPLMLLWANMHSGFLVGIGLLGLWVIGEVGNRLLGWGRPVPIQPLVAVTLSCGLIWLINPNGIDLLLLPLTYLGGPQAGNLLPFIQEWQPPDARKLATIPFVLTLLSLLAVMLWPHNPAPRPTPADDSQAPGDSGAAGVRLPFSGDAALLLEMGVFLLAALQATRLVPLWGTWWAVGMAVALPRLWPLLGRDRRAPPTPLRVRLNLGLAGVVLSGLAIFLLVTPRAQLGPQPHDTGYPAEAVAYLAAHPEIAADPLYNEYVWGGYLIAQRWPAHNVFIDGRADMYRGIVINDYIATLSGGPAWRRIFAKYGVHGALVPRNTPLAEVLAQEPTWQQVCCTSGPALVFAARP